MLSAAALVKPLASNKQLWQRHFMEKPEIKTRQERLAEALRANLRRRKVKDSDAKPVSFGDSSCPKSTD